LLHIMKQFSIPFYQVHLPSRFVYVCLSVRMNAKIFKWVFPIVNVFVISINSRINIAMSIIVIYIWNIIIVPKIPTIIRTDTKTNGKSIATLFIPVTRWAKEYNWLFKKYVSRRRYPTIWSIYINICICVYQYQ